MRSAWDLVLKIAFRLYCWLKVADPRNRARNARLQTSDELPNPPLDLIFAVAGTPYVESFLDGGRKAAASICGALAEQGAAIESVLPLLDFGCGCGRVVRHWRDLPGDRIFGTDYNPELVEWCRRNLPFGSFATNTLDPPLDYPDNRFGLVYALSVFTHLPAAAQTAWLAELRRTLRPGGYLLLSTHGRSYLSKLRREERHRFEAGELVTRFTGAAGTNLCSVYHPEPYVRGELAKGWDLVAFDPQGAKGNPHQDLVLLRKPAS